MGLNFQLLLYVERYNDRAKTFKILQGPIHQEKEAILEEAVFVCCFLANFSTSLV